MVNTATRRNGDIRRVQQGAIDFLVVLLEASASASTAATSATLSGNPSRNPSIVPVDVPPTDVHSTSANGTDNQPKMMTSSPLASSSAQNPSAPKEVNNRSASSSARVPSIAVGSVAVPATASSSETIGNQPRIMAATTTTKVPVKQIASVENKDCSCDASAVVAAQAPGAGKDKDSSNNSNIVDVAVAKVPELLVAVAVHGILPTPLIAGWSSVAWCAVRREFGYDGANREGEDGRCAEQEQCGVKQDGRVTSTSKCIPAPMQVAVNGSFLTSYED